jgi:2-methylcitrate dehydratase
MSAIKAKTTPKPAKRSEPDKVIQDIAAYVDSYKVQSPLAYSNAHYCLIDTLGCAFLALAYPECTKLLGPTFRSVTVSNGARVPGTSYVLDPIQAVFSFCAMVRWLEFNDATWGETVSHPSDTFGAILVVADWLSRTRIAEGKPPLTVGDIMEFAIKAYDIQGELGIENPFRRWGFDHTIVVKIAATAVLTKLLGGRYQEIFNAVSNAWLDGHALATFRSVHNTGSRKSWAGADCTSRGLWFASLALKGEMGYPTALTAKTWGFYDVLFKGKTFTFQRPYGSYIIENILFKIPHPTGFHAQSAVEAATLLHPLVKDRLDEVKTIEIWSHASCIAILDKRGPLDNPADRDHSLQYTTAIGLLHGRLRPEDFEDSVARDPRIDELRNKMNVIEDKRYTRGYSDPKRLSNAHAMRIHFADGTKTDRVEVEFSLGHPRRRKEGIPVLKAKFANSVRSVFAAKQAQAICDLCFDRKRLMALPVNELFDLLIK